MLFEECFNIIENMLENVQILGVAKGFSSKDIPQTP